VRSVPRLYNEIPRITGTVENKEKPGIGNIRGLNLAALKSTTVQVSNKLRHRLLHNRALTEVTVYIRTK
jgi:hypothetical protein